MKAGRGPKVRAKPLSRVSMSTALPLLLPPALSRVLAHLVLPASSSFDMALHLSFAAAELIVLALLLVQHASFMGAMHLAPWRAVVASIQAW